jgi:hypothetical protein
MLCFLSTSEDIHHPKNLPGKKLLAINTFSDIAISDLRHITNNMRWSK